MITSAHHCSSFDENNILFADDLFNTQPNVKIVEVDFITLEGKLLSSHDFEPENINKSSCLELWINVCCAKSKILWMDIKESLTSTTFDVNILESILKKIENSGQIPNLSDCLLISSQYHSVKSALLGSDYISKGFKIIHDLPMSESYGLWYVTPKCFGTWCIESYASSLDFDDIVALDISFLDILDIVRIINNSKPKEWILYSMDLTYHNQNKIYGIQGICSQKTIIPQYNYFVKRQ